MTGSGPRINATGMAPAAILKESTQVYRLRPSLSRRYRHLSREYLGSEGCPRHSYQRPNCLAVLAQVPGKLTSGMAWCSPTVPSVAVVVTVRFADSHSWPQGTFTFTNGDIYDGSWHENLRHGKGKCEYSSGETYIGAWFEDMRSGTGALQPHCLGLGARSTCVLPFTLECAILKRRAGNETIPRDRTLPKVPSHTTTLRIWPEPARPRVP